MITEAQTIAGIISGSGVAGIFAACLMMRWGIVPSWVVDEKDKTIEELKRENQIERQRADASVAAAAAARDIMYSLLGERGERALVAMDEARKDATERTGTSKRVAKTSRTGTGAHRARGNPPATPGGS